MLEFKLPSLGADMDEGKLLEWKVKPGDIVHKGQVVAVVDTAKAAIDVEIWTDGRIDALLVEPGATIPVGTPIAALSPIDETVTAAPAQAEPARPRISPAARRKAQERGIDAGALAGSGMGATVTLADIERATAATAMANTAKDDVQPATSVERTRATAMRTAIADAMSRSWREIPHYHLSQQIPLAHAQAWLLKTNAERPLPQHLLMAVLLLKAVALTLRDHPEFNGYYTDGLFRPEQAVHLGLAVSLRQGGLVAPALLNADSKPVDKLMQELADLVQRTRAGSLKRTELTAATATVTNLGEMGCDVVHGVIHPPQVALLGFGCIAARPWVENEALSIVPTVWATLAADHRVSDGHNGAHFLLALAERLQQPALL